MAFEVVQLSGMAWHYRTTPWVRIYENGQCGINEAAERDFLLKPGKHVKFYFDRENKQIGFEIVNNSENGTGVVSRYRVLNLRRFFYYYKLNLKNYAGRYDLIPHGKLCVIDLNKRKPLMIRKRKQSDKA